MRMKRQVVAIMAAALAGCSTTTPTVAPATTALAPAEPMMTTMVEATLRKHSVPGVQIVELAACKPVSALEAGLAVVEDGVPVTRDTLFEAASLSKPVFAFLVMKLVDEGVVDLDRSLLEDGFQFSRITDQERYALLTPRLLLSHRSGLPNWGADPLGPEANAPLEFEGVTGEFGYSGEGFQLLQAYVEWKTGKSLPQLFEAALGDMMPHSQFAGPLSEYAIASRGYDGEESRAIGALPGNGLAAASLLTTAHDYARFVSAVCSGAGLSEAAHKQMLSVQSEWYDTKDEIPTARLLGWSEMAVGGERFIVHGGNNGEYRALAGFDPESGEGIVIMTNGSSGHYLIEELVGLMNTSR